MALRFGPDGALYVSVPAYGADEGSGQVLRVEVAAGTPGAAAGQATPVAASSS